MTVILASQSPRRRELLATLGVEFQVASADIDESVRKNESAYDYVLRLAQQKAQAVAEKISNPDAVVIGSDTSVIFEAKILGKPLDEADFSQMMNMLSGQSHQVMTAVAMVQGSHLISKVISTDVVFKTLSKDLIARYWQTGEPVDKAGGYGIQGFGSFLVDHIRGSYSAVVGLPLSETGQMLVDCNIPIWNGTLNAKDL
ncbi:Maf family protein [Reinekea sp.]|jgi:septum formation protein|uniref:Maf family protein n=1 Tax=Reinekea sp. TaxID=1970455 RepID=UPI0039892CBA